MSKHNLFFDFDLHCDGPEGQDGEERRQEHQRSVPEKSDIHIGTLLQNVVNDDSLRLIQPSAVDVVCLQEICLSKIDKQVVCQLKNMDIRDDTNVKIEIPREIQTFLNDTMDFDGFQIQNKVSEQIGENIITKDTNLLHNSQINQKDHYIILDIVVPPQVKIQSKKKLHLEQGDFDKPEQPIINPLISNGLDDDHPIQNIGNGDKSSKAGFTFIPQQSHSVFSRFQFSENKEISSHEQIQVNLLPYFLNDDVTFRSPKGSEICEQIPREVDPDEEDWKISSSKPHKSPIKDNRIHFNLFSEQIDQSTKAEEEKPRQIEPMKLVEQNMVCAKKLQLFPVNQLRLKFEHLSSQKPNAMLSCSEILQTNISQTLQKMRSNEQKDKQIKCITVIPRQEMHQSQFNSYQTFCENFNINSPHKAQNQIKQICQQQENQVHSQIQRLSSLIGSNPSVQDHNFEGQKQNPSNIQKIQEQNTGLDISILPLQDNHQQTLSIQQKQPSRKKESQSDIFKRQTLLVSQKSNQKGFHISNPQNDFHHTSSNKRSMQMEIEGQAISHAINHQNNLLGAYNQSHLPWYGRHPGFFIPFYPPMPTNNIQTSNQPQFRQIGQNVDVPPFSTACHIPSPLLSISINKMNEITLNMYGNNNCSNVQNQDKINQSNHDSPNNPENKETNNQNKMIKTILELVRQQIKNSKEQTSKLEQYTNRNQQHLNQQEAEINQQRLSTTRQNMSIQTKTSEQKSMDSLETQSLIGQAKTEAQMGSLTLEIEKNVQYMADSYLMNRALTESDHKQFQNILKPHVLLKFTPEPIGEVGRELFKNGLILMAMVKLINRSSNTPFIFNYVYEYLSNTFNPTKNQFIFAQQAAKSKRNYQLYLQKQYLQQYASKRNELQEKQQVIRRQRYDQKPFNSIYYEKVNSYQQTLEKKLQIGSRAVNVNEQLTPLLPPEQPEEKTQTKSKSINIPDLMNNCPSSQLCKKGILKTSQMKQSKKQKQNPISPQMKDDTQPELCKFENVIKKASEQRQQQASKYKNFDKINTMIKLSQKLEFGEQNTSQKNYAVQQASKKDSMIIYDKKRQPMASFNDLYEKYKKIKDIKKNSSEMVTQNDYSSKQKSIDSKTEESEIKLQKMSRKVTFQDESIVAKPTANTQCIQGQSLGKKRKTRSRSRVIPEVAIEAGDNDENVKDKLRKKIFSKK